MSWDRLLKFLEANIELINIHGIERKLGMGTGTLRRIVLEKRQSKKYGEELLALFSAFSIELSDVYE